MSFSLDPFVRRNSLGNFSDLKSGCPWPSCSEDFCELLIIWQCHVNSGTGPGVQRPRKSPSDQRRAEKSPKFRGRKLCEVRLKDLAGDIFISHYEICFYQKYNIKIKLLNLTYVDMTV
eukprot:scaffold8447_cov66-Cyclotella_meneghiniana.AAC.8